MVNKTWKSVEFSLRTIKICRFEIIDGVKYIVCLLHKTRLQIFSEGTSRVCGRSLTLASKCFLLEVIHISTFDTMLKNPCIWRLKSCQLNVDFTSQLWCWLCIFRQNRNLFWNTKASANASAFLFQTAFLHLGGYFAINTTMHALFLNSSVINTANLYYSDWSKTKLNVFESVSPLT